MNNAVADIRREYRQTALHKDAVLADPIEQFKQWLGDARTAELIEPTAMTLATATPDGRPSARIVLLKGIDESGFVFFTNYTSHKGHQLDANPWAALVFWWDVLERQVRVEGTVSRIMPEASEAYFQSRPRGSQLGAWVSPQSQPISARNVLESNLADVEARFAGQAVPRPPHWGGFRLDPVAIEFWQGRPSRLHDRLRYTRTEDDDLWHLERLAP
jgi:pyridoxamine 5'-phosphate oxidase